MEKFFAEPLRFVPHFKTVIWGGNNIRTYKGLAPSDEKIGESWEISAVPGSESIVAEGRYAGISLTELIERFGARLLGDKVIEKYGPKFPLLVKIIDAADNLSVQVHPDDELAMSRHNSLGKTEMWYIIRTEENAKIFAGLNREISADEYVRQVEANTFASLLAEHESAAGDVFFLPAGRVHAIGAGNMLAEIQENSDITYRIYDYDRRDAQGKPRELHVDQAKDAIDYRVYPDYRSPAPEGRPVSSDESVCRASEASLANCAHFDVKRLTIDGELSLANSSDSFLVILCTEGSVEVLTADSTTVLTAGHTLLIPASLPSLTLRGRATLLTARVPS